MGRERVALRPQAHDALVALGGQVRVARQSLSLTIEDLANRAAVSARTVSQIEKGSASVSAGNLFNVAVAAGVNLFGTADGTHLALIAARLQTLASAGGVRVVPTREGGVQDDF